MIKANKYYDKNLNPESKGIEHDFKGLPGDSVIFDAATGLTWQQSGSGSGTYLSAKDYIEKINAETFGGYNDWRLPTLEEAMSLMEPEVTNDLYIAEKFDTVQTHIWTADKFTASAAWLVNFTNGYCQRLFVNLNNFVRAVRPGNKLTVSK